jgi:hypothetical protein
MKRRKSAKMIRPQMIILLDGKKSVVTSVENVLRGAVPMIKIDCEGAIIFRSPGAKIDLG